MLVIENLVKTFAGEKSRGAGDGRPSTSQRVRAVDGINLEVEDGEMFTLLGPSGCGKTTTLRSVAGLDHPDSGEIRVDDHVLFSKGNDKRNVHVPANRRGLGMVFQSYAIWPHMKVFDNVAFPLKVLPRTDRPSRAEIRSRVMAVLEKMELHELADRPATKLSGGQQQRLALARALVIEPPLMLLDEPLSNLDAKLRDSLRFELKRLQRELGITSVYVTHDQIEALSLSSRIAVMREGEVMQTGKPRDIYQHPANRFVAEFIGTSNLFAGTVTANEPDALIVDTEHAPLRVGTDRHVPKGEAVLLAIRPEAIGLREGAPTRQTPNELEGKVTARSFMGDSVDHMVAVNGLELRVRTNPDISIPADSQVTLTIEASNLSLIPFDG